MLDMEKSGKIELLCAVLNAGMASKAIHCAKENGISGSTVLLAKGTVNNRILDFFGLADTRKEVVFFIAEQTQVLKVAEKLNNLFVFEKAHHGIAFTLSVCDVMGSRSVGECIWENKNTEGNVVYNLITIIVDKGKGEDVIDAAIKAGSKGGTIINGRGSGVHERSKVFAMDIEPEKEIVMILSDSEATEQIARSIANDIKMDIPGNGIIYVQNVNKTYGLFDAKGKPIE